MEESLRKIWNDISELITKAVTSLMKSIDSSNDIKKITNPVKNALTSLGLRADGITPTGLLGIFIFTVLTVLSLIFCGLCLISFLF